MAHSTGPSERLDVSGACKRQLWVFAFRAATGQSDMRRSGQAVQAKDLKLAAQKRNSAKQDPVAVLRPTRTLSFLEQPLSESRTIRPVTRDCYA
jgi:hypothetical protein